MDINEFKERIDEPFDGDSQRRKPAERKCAKKVILSRTVISLILALLLVASLAWTWLFTIMHGPSITYRNEMVHRYNANDLTGWVPYLVLPASEVEAIISGAEVRD